MGPIPHIKLDWQPIAHPGAVVTAPYTRFSMLTPRLLRLEYSPEKHFEDRPSQLAWYRKLPVPDFSSSSEPEQVDIETTALHLQYNPSPKGFSSSSLAITIKETGRTWHFGDNDHSNLHGTIRTLDNIDGRTSLEPGLLSRDGWTLVDDSTSLVFNQTGWIEPRRASRGSLDLYFFGYGRDYAACLQDYQTLTGPCPMIPRQILGNWWSRYHAYSGSELLQLMHRFKKEHIPLSVCVIDMDWHLTETGNQSTGWTGYTWDRDLFPNPEETLSQLHDLGLLVSLNLHPAEGIHPHEEAYPEFAMRLGIDPESEDPISFDLTDPEFAAAYFELLHHPQEKIGLDFWWLDWQQGETTSLPGLDPLWWLNHLHFHDLGRNGVKRPLIFSRWGGHGSHRTPIGFSGDAEVTWQSLAFQPYLTAASANVAYGWWSHDIGGHMGGVEDPELYLRWVQFGVFSPIFRFHSTKGRFHERLPWKFDAETAKLSSEILRFRHQMIPCLYGMAWRYHRTGQALVQPMYHLYPKSEEAYACPQQYTFGPDMIAAPFTTPADTETGLSRQVVWLPPKKEENSRSGEESSAGEWYSLFSGEVLTYGWHAVYGSKADIPVYIRAGAILPLAAEDSLQVEALPPKLELRLYAGGNGTFDLYEDDGASTAYQNGMYVRTHLSQQMTSDGFRFTISPPHGEKSLLPEQRTFVINWVGIKEPDSLTVLRNNKLLEVSWEYDPAAGSLHLSPISLSTADSLDLSIGYAQQIRLHRPDLRRSLLFKLLNHFKLNTWIKERIFQHADEIFADFNFLQRYFQTEPDSLTESQVQTLFESFCGAGLLHSTLTDEEFLVVWNRHQREDFTILDRSWVPEKPWNDTGAFTETIVPDFRKLSLDPRESVQHGYTVKFGDFFSLSFRNQGKYK